MDEYVQQARLLKTLAHPVRLQILDLLRQEPECVCHLTAVLRQRQAYVSQQLSVLRSARLINDRKEGLRVYYHINDPQILDLIDRVGKMLGHESKPAVQRRVMVAECPCPKCQPQS